MAIQTPGTEDGITEPSPTFSTCFGQPFIVLHRTSDIIFAAEAVLVHKTDARSARYVASRYASMLATRMVASGTKCWLINTGWSGGKFGVGKRCPLKYTRAIIDAIHDGSLAKADFVNFDVFNLSIPVSIPGVPTELLDPVQAWSDKAAFTSERVKLAGMFKTAFARFEADCGAEGEFFFLLSFFSSLLLELTIALLFHAQSSLLDPSYKRFFWQTQFTKQIAFLFPLLRLVVVQC